MTSSHEEPIKPLKVISASAGTGKTHQLSGEYLRALRKETDATAQSRGIIATTFTNKAAHELVERVRRMLLQDGEWEAAQDVLTGYLGTVNSICGRLVSEHAIEAGLSPDFNVISEEQLPAVFAIAVDTVIGEFADEIDVSALRLQIDWRKDVQKIIDYARNNDLGAKLLEEFAERSWQQLSKLLPSISDPENGEGLDRRLAESVDQALRELAAGEDRGDFTARAIDTLKEVNRNLKAERILNWQVWARLSKLQTNGPSAQSVKSVHEAAAAHSQHPRLHEDLRNTIFGVFRCAAAAILEYTRFKREHGLIDFVDQEHLALRILRLPEVKSSFKEKVRILLVDEFQDTSPLQLAVFLEMARLVDYSVWVGDEKQCIFEFRGSDPDLMREAVTQLVSSSGAKRTRLRRSYRSRPSLVNFANELFVRTATLMNIDPKSAVIDEVERRELDEQNSPLHLWWLQEGDKKRALRALSQAISNVLADSEKWQVVDRYTKQLRPIKGSDIAVLCRWNRSRKDVAQALSDQGLTVATERNLLLETPECMLALAAFRFLLDETDSLALVEIANLLSPAQNGDWLDDWMSGGANAMEARVPCAAKLRSARSLLFNRTPSEVLELAIGYGGVLETAMSWGNVRQRLANIDALRGLARTFEELCGSAKTPATAAGLVIYLHKHVRDGGYQPANPDENGIHILTYHRSKGLEWPFVILFDLDAPARGSAFGITVESEAEGLDPLQPLKGRTIRYWPWPYGFQRVDVPLDQALAKTAEARLSRQRVTAENLRLLYVGVTRARDYLVFAAQPTRTKTRSGTAWLDTLVDDDQQKILSLPFPDRPSVFAEILEGIPASRTNVEIKTVENVPTTTSTDVVNVFVPAFAPNVAIELDSSEVSDLEPELLDSLDLTGTDGGAFDAPLIGSNQTELLNYFLSPSTADDTAVLIRDGRPPETIVIGQRLTLSGKPDMRLLGECVHAFLAVDDRLNNKEDRESQARSILHNWGIANLRAEDLVLSSDRLHSFVELNFPDAELSPEVPIRGRFKSQRVNGTIDLLLEVPSGFVIIDHKTFPGRFEDWHSHALKYRAQMALYRYLVEQITGKPVLAQYIHMPVVGAMIKLDCCVTALELAETIIKS